MPTPLHRLAAAGQSIWVDDLSRSLLTSGDLARKLDSQAVTGVTSNPTIFAKAIAGTDHYDDYVGELARRGASTAEIYASLVTRDIQHACDILEPVWNESSGGDGFVSVEVSPELASDTEGTVAEAREWVKRVDRPNLLIKVPATAEGVPAVQTLIAEGISVNVTLIFGLERYRAVMDAYLSGLEEYSAAGGNPAGVSSVASFFVSRFETEVDKRLNAEGSEQALSLAGTTAVANARAAYGLFRDSFSGDRWTSLTNAGASVQRPLWASTSTKNSAYSDILYVEELIAEQTVNTVPQKTLAAYADHGPMDPQPFDGEDIETAREILGQLEDVGIEYDDVTAVLEREGVEKFAASFDEMIQSINAERVRLS